jgi:hypothetical protein
MLGDKRRYLLESDETSDDELGLLPVKRVCFANGEVKDFTSFGPVPITSFDSSLFSKDVLIMVLSPVKSVTQMAAVSLTDPFLQDRESPSSLTSCGIPLPSPDDFELGALSIGAVKPRTLDDCGEPCVKRVPPLKLTESDILSLKGVRPFERPKPFTSGVVITDVSVNMIVKRRILSLLLSSASTWNGLAVLTLPKTDKRGGLIPHMFVDNIGSISQYVRPLGFLPGQLIMPSNAICYTSYNKGNHQVTYILTDVIKFNDVVDAADKIKKRRMSYGMTVIKKYQQPKEVQFCLMTLLALCFHLLRQWFRQSPAFQALLDPQFVEPSFEELQHNILEQSKLHLSVPFSTQDIFYLLERSDCLFKKLIQLFQDLYS